METTDPDTGDADIWIGSAAGSANSFYELSGSTSQFAVGDDLIVGGPVAATFRQSDGTASVADDVFLGYSSGGDGVYEMSGGQLTVGGYIYGGYGGGSKGTLRLIGGVVNTYRAFIGNSGEGFVQQTGGSLTVSDDFYRASGSSSTCDYALSGGAISARRFLIGLHGVAQFTQTGGDLSVRPPAASPDLTIAWYTDGVGTYTISGGTVSATQLRNGSSGTGLFEVQGGRATIQADRYLQNAISTLNPFVGSTGLSTIDVAATATISTGATLDVDVWGGVAMTATSFFDVMETATAGNISGSFTIADPEPLWSVTQDGTVVRAQLAGTDYGPVAADYVGMTELEIDSGAGANLGYLTLTDVLPGNALWVLFDVEQGGLDLTGAALNDLADYIRTSGQDVFTTHPVLERATTYDYNLAFLFQPSATTSYLLWDFSDYNDALRVSHVGQGIPEPATLLLLGLGLLPIARKRRS